MDLLSFLWRVFKMKCLQCTREIKSMSKFCCFHCEDLYFGENKFECFIDGTCLCVVAKGFKSLQENDAVFVGLTPDQITDITNLIKRPKKKK